MPFDLKNTLLPFVVFIVSLVVLMLLRAVLFGQLKKWLNKTPFKFDLLLFKSIRFASVLWCMAVSLYAAIEIAELPKRQYELINKALVVLIIFSFSLAIANFIGRLFKNYVEKLEIPIPTTGLFYVLLKGTIIAVGLIIVMSSLGISIAPVLTALGIGGLAVALAFKDTLENLFAGIHILLEKTIRVGDFIRLENGQEGFVQDITWRTTRIKTIQNNTVIIPNSKLSQSIVLNYSLPDNKMSLSMTISVSYDSDPEEVERVLIDEFMKSKAEIEEIVEDSNPVVRFNPGFGDSSLDFTLSFQIKHASQQFAALHSLRKRIFKRFKEEGLEIPYPQRVLHIKQGS